MNHNLRDKLYQRKAIGTLWYHFSPAKCRFIEYKTYISVCPAQQVLKVQLHPSQLCSLSLSVSVRPLYLFVSAAPDNTSFSQHKSWLTKPQPELFVHVCSAVWKRKVFQRYSVPQTPATNMSQGGWDNRTWLHSVTVLEPWDVRDSHPCAGHEVPWR